MRGGTHVKSDPFKFMFSRWKENGKVFMLILQLHEKHLFEYVPGLDSPFSSFTLKTNDKLKADHSVLEGMVRNL